jgi:hypothetical protein
MAITLDQSPIGWIYGRNKVIIAASSGNYANDGFRYVFEVEVAGETTTFQLPPNPANSAIIDLSKHITQYLGPRMNGESTQTSIHELGRSTANLHLNELASTNATTTCQLVAVTVKEGWVIAGVFTPTATGQATCSFVAHNATLKGSWPEFNLLSPPFDLSERDLYTGATEFEMAESYGLSNLGGIKIPCTANDKGILTFITDNGTYYAGGFVGNYKIRGVIYDSAGSPTTKDITIAAAAGQITHFGCFPYNLSQSTIGAGFFDPSAFANYRFYTITLLDASNNPLSDQYIFFNKDYHCKIYDGSATPNYIRMAWVNDFGGWDYFNFNYLNQYTQKTERKRMRAISGVYTGTSYTVKKYDRGVKELSTYSERTLSVTSKPLDMGEWRLMSSLIRSTEVQIVNTNITGDGYTADPIPVVIETNDNVEHRPLDSRLRSITLLAREAHPVV